MSQTLLLHINRTRLTASWKTQAYRQRFGFHHYGVDMVSAAGQTLVYAGGTGTVLAAGLDSVLGNILVIRYDRALSHSGAQAELVCRLFHFASLLVRQGQRVTKDIPLGRYGNTGRYSAGSHLHLELDTDTRYPFYTPTLSGRSSFFSGSGLGATDATMVNPMSWLYCKTSAPDSQSYTTAGDRYIRPEDEAVPVIE